jgi:signal transduction histidine kinase
MPQFYRPEFINTIGHTAGAVIFGIFLVLLCRDRAGIRLRGRRLSLAAAALAFLWNLGSLAVLVTGPQPRADLLAALTFSVLSLLPAVLLHLCLGDSFRTVAVAGYLLSGGAMAMHLSELVRPSADLHWQALLLITVGFAVLTAISVTGVAMRAAPDKRGKASRIAGAMCAALFAMSFVHFGPTHPHQAWSSELALHHAGIPLALFVLLQDYRFLLLDAFARFLANVLLAAVLTFGAIQLGLQLSAALPGLSGPFYDGLLLSALCLLLIIFAFVRGHFQRWLTRVVFRRPDLEKALHEMRAGAPLFEQEHEIPAWGTRHLGRIANARRAEAAPETALAPLNGDRRLLYPEPAAHLPGLRQVPGFEWVEAVVPLRPSQGAAHFVLLGRRRGGQPYLSEDFQFLGRLAGVVVEQIENFRNSEMQRLLSQAELKALQSQMNPHFLFNALNTLYGVIPRGSAEARRMVLNLADIFRYFLRSEGNFVPLSEELRIIRAYLEIEQLRLGPRLQVEIDVDEAALAVPIPLLSVQPLVENAVKHGVAAAPDAGRLRLEVKALENEVRISVEDTGPGMQDRANESAGAGVGLANVQRRIHLCYGAALAIDSGPSGTRVGFSVPLPKAAVAR